MIITPVYSDEWLYDSDFDEYLNSVSGEVMAAHEFESRLYGDNK